MFEPYKNLRGAGIRHTLPFVVRFSGLWFLVTTAVVVVLAVGSYLALADRLPPDSRVGLAVLFAAQTLLLILGLAVLAVFHTHRLAGPFIALKQAFEEVKNGDLERRLHLRRADHLQEIETGFNDMMAALRERLRRAGGQPG